MNNEDCSTDSRQDVLFMDSYVPGQMPVNAFQLYGRSGYRCD